MYRSKWVSGLVITAGLLALALPAAAQEIPSVELSGGYNLLRFSDETVPGGWYVDVAGNMTQVLSIVGQVSGNYKNVGAEGISIDTKVHGFLGGLRINTRTNPRVVPFAQVLFGTIRTSASTDASGLLPFSVSGSQTDGALQVGGGVNFMAGRKIGVRLGADYMRMFTEDEGTNAFRLTAGVVIPLG